MNSNRLEEAFFYATIFYAFKLFFSLLWIGVLATLAVATVIVTFVKDFVYLNFFNDSSRS